jgi:hypothetical protein
MERDVRLLVRVRCYDVTAKEVAAALVGCCYPLNDGEVEILSVTLLAESARPLRADATDPNPED